MFEVLKKVIAMFKSFRIDPRFIFLYTAQNCLGKSLCNGNKDLGCVIAWQNLHNIAFGSKLGTTESTIGLYTALINNHGFTQVYSPLPGDTVLSVTEGAKRGHVGIMLSNGIIASNNSLTGLLDSKYTLLTWKLKYINELGLRTIYFRKIIG